MATRKITSKCLDYLLTISDEFSRKSVFSTENFSREISLFFSSKYSPTICAQNILFQNNNIFCQLWICKNVEFCFLFSSKNRSISTTFFSTWDLQLKLLRSTLVLWNLLWKKGKEILFWIWKLRINLSDIKWNSSI